MIVFYQKAKEQKVIELHTKSCTTVCASSCIKPKTKCCKKYLKKGINCKRCPKILAVKAVS